MENSKSFTMKCVAVKESSMTLLKVYAEDGTSVSLPKEARANLTEGKVFECSLHLSKDGRFYVAEDFGKSKATKGQKANQLAKYFNK